MSQDPETTVAAIITDKDSTGVRVLLTKRGSQVTHYPNQWCLPGGHIEPGELWVEAVRREIEEETNLDFRPRFFAGFDEIIPEYSLHHVVKVFEGCASGELKARPPEVVEVRWVPLSEASTWPLAFHHNEIVDAYADRTMKSERREELLAEYDALRSEVLKRIDLRYQSLYLAITATGIFIAAAVSNLIVPIALMLYPLLALFIATAWTHNDFRVGQIGQHIKENIEQQLPGISWEFCLLERYAEVPHPIYKRFTEVTALGVFIGTDLLAVVFSVLFQLIQHAQGSAPSFPPIALGAYIGLGILDFLAVLATRWLVLLRRRKYRQEERS